MSFRNIGELLDERVSEHRDKPFLFDAARERSWTYATFAKSVDALAARLVEGGVVRGDVVSLLLPNSPEYVIAYFACWRIGALAGPINSLLKPEEVEWAVGNSESKLLIFSKEFTALQSGADVPARLELNDIAEVASVTGSEPLNPHLSPDDEAVIIYTSGTTGKPKGCLLTHGNLLANAAQITNWMSFGTEDRLLTVMPLFHMNAVSVTTMTALFCGGSTVVAPKFSASRFWETVEKFSITSFGSVATMLSMLLANAEGPDAAGNAPPPTSLRFAMCGSAPVPAEVLRKFEETFGTLVIEGYGLSESTCRSTFNPPNESRRPGSCGLPIGNEMKVVDEENREVADGELGEIVLRGPNVLKGYFKNAEATAKAFEGGWFHTGDIGFRDADGFFYIADRKSDMIIRGGENIYPREIDDLLYTHPAVEAVAVLGVPDELYGEEVAAFIVLKKGFAAPGDSAVTPDEIIDFCKQHLADYKCPKTVHFVADIPKGPTGKLLKRELAKLVS